MAAGCYFGAGKTVSMMPSSSAKGSGGRGNLTGFGTCGSLFHKRYGGLLAGEDAQAGGKKACPANWERPVDDDERPRAKLKKVKGGSSRSSSSVVFSYFGAGNCRAANLEAGKPPLSPDRKKDKKGAGVCGPYIKKDDKEKDECTGRKKIAAFADEGTVFADIKNPEKNLDPDTEEGQRSRRNILKWLKVYSENAAECTRRQNDAVLFS